VKPNVCLSIFEYACERRELDAWRIINFFEKNGYPIVKNPKKAGIIIYISCGIIEKNTEASIAAIKELKKYKARLIVGGCATEIDPLRVRAVHDGEYFSTKNLEELDRLFPNEEYPFKNIADANCRYTVMKKNIWNGTILRFIDIIPGIGSLFRLIVKANTARLFGKYSFAYIKAVGLEKDFYIRIAEGCASACSYCALPAAIGRLKSKSSAMCLQELKIALEKGYKNITITAEDTGVWGTDFSPADNRENITTLLEQMLAVSASYKNNCSFILSSLNPAILHRHISSFTNIFRNPVFRCVVIPVQSLVNRILKLMNRFSDTDAIGESLKAVREASPSLWISTHILVGFPSETTDELYETLSLWEKLPFDEGQFFAYSLKPDTPAAKIDGRISEEEIRSRMKLAYKYFKRKGYACFFHDYDFLFVSKKSGKK
jgi:tRNA A37 methylthiotransferase MiaB